MSYDKWLKFGPHPAMEHSPFVDDADLPFNNRDFP